MVQLSYLYMTTRKIIALTIWTFVGKVMFFYHIDIEREGGRTVVRTLAFLTLKTVLSPNLMRGAARPT